MKLKTLESLSLLLFVFGVVYGDVCTPSTASGPDFPKLFNKETGFTLKTEVNFDYFALNIPDIAEKSTSIFFEEYYLDIPRDKKGRVNRYTEKELQSTFYGQLNNKVINIKGAHCSVVNYRQSTLNDSFAEFWGFDDTLHDGDSYMFGPSSVWVNAYHKVSEDKNNGKPIFWKKEPVRGINANIFKACYNTGQNKGKPLTVTYAVDASNSRPLRTTIDGYYNQGYFAKGHQTYNYIFFERSVKDIEVFQIPTGIGCDGMKPTRGFRPPAPIFSFKAELSHSYHSYYSTTHRIDYFTMMYDYPQRITTIVDQKSDSITTHINDYNTGVTYALHDSYSADSDGSSCKIVSIADGMDEDQTLGKKTKGSVIPHIQNPDAYFDNNSTFYLIGQTYSRGIDVSIFETVKYNYTEKITNKRFYKFVVTFFLAANAWKEYSTEDGKVTEAQFPVRLKTVGYDSKLNEVFNVTMNYFEYDVKDIGSELSGYYGGIENCFETKDQLRHIEMVFPRQPKDIHVISNIGGRFSQAIRSKIAEINKVSILRIPRVDIDYDKFNVYANVYVTERLPPMSRFTNLESDHSDYVPETATLKPSIGSQSNCAFECLEDDTCKVFYSCGNEDVSCYTDTTTFPAAGTAFKTSVACYKYIKNSFIIKGDLNVSSLLINLENVQMKGGIEIKQKNVPGLKPPTFTYVSSKEHEISPKGHVKKIGIDFKASLSGVEMKELGADISSMTTKSLIDCESFCRKDKDCNTVSYCPLSGSCKLSSIYMDELANNTRYLLKDTGCDIYIKPYLDSFQESRGQVTLEPAEKEVVEASSPAKCAKACVDEDGFTCKSFQFCEKTLTCLLHKKSYLSRNDSKAVHKTREACSLYRRILMDGFNLDGYKEITGYSGTLIEDISFDDCYTECNKDSVDCNSYDYCSTYKGDDGQGLCILRKQSHAPAHPEHKLKSKVECVAFQRMKKETNPYKSHDSNDQDAGKKPDAQKDTETKKETGWSKGSAAGLCIGLFTVGLVLGAIVYFAVTTMQKRRSRGGDGMTISFSKQQSMDA